MRKPMSRSRRRFLKGTALVGGGTVVGYVVGKYRLIGKVVRALSKGRSQPVVKEPVPKAGVSPAGKRQQTVSKAKVVKKTPAEKTAEINKILNARKKDKIKLNTDWWSERQLTAKDFKNAGYDLAGLHKIGLHLPALFDLGFTKADFVGAGFNARYLLNRNYHPGFVREIFTIKEFKKGGFDLYRLLQMKFRPYFLHGLGFGADFRDPKIIKHLIRKKYHPVNFAELGIRVGDLKKAGFTAKWFLNKGYSKSFLRELGFTEREIAGR